MFYDTKAIVSEGFGEVSNISSSGREVGVSQSSLLLPDQKPVPIHFSVPRTQDLDALDTH